MDLLEYKSSKIQNVCFGEKDGKNRLKPDPKNVLIIIDKKDVQHLDISATSQNWNIVYKIIDYGQIHSRIDAIRKLVVENDIDFLLYSRNDQVDRKIKIGPIHARLKVGYSSFSGIDDDDRIIQMQTCFRNFMEGGTLLKVDHLSNTGKYNHQSGDGTFSLIFDTEQIGCVRYGLPRIIGLLEQYGIKATFFVTNLMKRFYQNVVEVIKSYGNEVGLHGLCHEYLSGLSMEEQEKKLSIMRKDIGTNAVGVNFMGRMDYTTVHACTRLGLKYFVYPCFNYYRIFGYPKVSTAPLLISNVHGNIWALPVAVQTYGSPWPCIKNMVSLAILQSFNCGLRHISILLHPFRDGNLRYIQTTDKLIRYLLQSGLSPVTASEVIDRLEGTYQYRIEQEGTLPSLLNTARPMICLPSSRWDVFGFFPENGLRILQRLKPHTQIF